MSDQHAKGAEESGKSTTQHAIEDTNMPLSELLGRIEAYVTQFGTK